MKPRYPQILSWLAGKHGTSGDVAEHLWIRALRAATAESAVIESPEYWKSAVDHLRASFANHSPAGFPGSALTALPKRPGLLMV